ncbi:MAG: hypothetical protein DDG59_03770 [Anaerolineae bacterium]|jgi:hypothetical protein|nr:MAG: hypothetical protein DDG59_03770 [Anaerolineae bacterium]
MKWWRRIFISLWFLGWIFWQAGAGVQIAAAQTPKPGQDESCFKCHANLYQLHDSGKWYCLCGTRARCSFCHGGVVGSVDLELAHQNLIANPILQNRAVCQQCHPQDAEQRIATFIAKAGVKTPPAHDRVAVAAVGNAGALPAALQEKPPSPWKTVAWVVLGFAAVGVLALAWHCYRLDCLRRQSNP